jgi:hypothetical protein
MQPHHSPTHDDDDTLLAELRRVVAVIDPVPEAVRVSARAALDWRTLEAELAELVHDSRIDEPALAVRGGSEAGARTLTFEADGLEIELEAEPQDDGDRLRITGQLVPPQTAQIGIATGAGLVLTRADERGRFAALGVARGRMRLRCWLDGAPDGGRLVETAWLVI